MEARIFGLTTTSSVLSNDLNSDLHFVKERVREFSALGNPKRFITSPTEIRRTNYRKAAGHLRSWLADTADTDTEHYDELEASLSKDKVKMREG